MWHWGNKELAVLATARHEPLGASSAVIESDVSRLNKPLQDELERLYPYSRNKRSASEKSYKTIQETNRVFARQLRELTWIPTLDNELLEQLGPYVTGTSTSRRYTIPQNIRALTYALFFEIVKRQEVIDPVSVANDIARKKGLMD